MADALISVVLQQLRSSVIDEITKHFGLVVGVEEAVERLKSNLLAIKAVLVDAEKRQFKEETVKQWIDKLKEVCYDADDILDEWNTSIVKSKIEMEDKGEASSKPRKKVCSFIPSCFSCHEVGERHHVACELEKINGRLNDIALEKNKYDFALSKDVEPVERLMTTSVVDITEVKGRDHDRDKIKGMLLGESNEQSNTNVISVVGMGGLGKTTLAKLVYNDDEVNFHFEKRIWVCVSDPFDVIMVTKEILESLTGETPNLVGLQALLQRLQQIIKEKKFFLVLDDVWEEDYGKWEQLKHCLVCGSPGSKILVTTRKETVAKMMGSRHVYNLGMLSLEECWSIISKVAFFGRTRGECERLESIGRKIAYKCKGLPLGAKTLGGLLSFKKFKEEWQTVLDSELWDLEEAKRDILMAPLRLSYYDLPIELRRCFSFCVLFPKDYAIQKMKLIELWMAEGFLKKTRGKSMSAIGEEYFQNLAVRSFFQDFEMDLFDGRIKSCKMHDMLHDFAQFLTRNECFHIEINSPCEELRVASLGKELRHLRLVLPENAAFANSICHIEKLRSLLILSKGNLRIESSVLADLFDNLPCLRSLSLARCRIVEIPSNINKLVHLRQLDLSGNSLLKELPETFCELYNLIALDVSGCERLALPHGIEKLINLRHLHNDARNNPFWIRYGCTCPLPKGIGRLSSLEILKHFVIEHDGEASNLENLNSLNCLRKTLCISGLENLRNSKDLEQAQFSKKTQLSSLKLSFGRWKADSAEWRESHDEELIEVLEPPPNIEALWLEDCQATRVFPSWMISLSNLRILGLNNCINCEVLPPLGKLPWLEELRLWNMNTVKKVGCEFWGIERGENSISSSTVAFPRLTNLSFNGMPSWEEWDDGDTDNTFVMPCLQSLGLFDCGTLQELPFYILQSRTLKELHIWFCDRLEVRYGKAYEDWSKIAHIPKVTVGGR